jgi:hypothetical protein
MTGKRRRETPEENMAQVRALVLAGQHQRFLKADLATQVREATPIARELIVNGPMDTRNGDDDVMIRVKALIGHEGPETDREGDTELMMEALYTAYAIGIAVGLLLRPELFQGGAR